MSFKEKIGRNIRHTKMRLLEENVLELELLKIITSIFNDSIKIL